MSAPALRAPFPWSGDVLDLALRYVTAGLLRVDPDGAVWRVAVLRRGAVRAVAPRRAESVGSKGYLRIVRVACGDWHRVVASPSVLFPEGRAGGSTCGVYLDPPYAEGRADYATGGTGTDLSARVRAWCEKHGDNPRMRIVLSGYEGEHGVLTARGWRVVEWRTKGGYSSAGGENTNQRRERLWLSPHCEGARQLSLLDAGGAS